MYNGEDDVLAVRLEELYEVVDEFILLEFSRTFSGLKKTQKFSEARFSKYNEKLKAHFIEEDDSKSFSDAWEREAFQRNYLSNLVNKNRESLILLSDVDEIPSWEAVLAIKEERGNSKYYGFQAQLHYFAFDFICVSGPDAQQILTVAFPARFLNFSTPEHARRSIRSGELPAKKLLNSGWHLSYFLDTKGLKGKIADFSHQEFNNEEFLASIDLGKILTLNLDLFARGDLSWQKYTPRRLPKLVSKDPQLARKFSVNGILESLLEIQTELECDRGI
jgi:beta-1,4-mannosyl-glycoprotein beta-1,4-N-acetylglucosaminyltransferase